MKFRSFKINSAGEVCVGWESSNGQIVTVRKAWPLPEGKLSEALNALIPFAAQLSENKDGKNLYVNSISYKEDEKKGDTVQITAAMAVQGSAKSAQIKFPKLLIQGESESQTVMWQDFRSSVNTLLDQCEKYVKSVKDSL